MFHPSTETITIAMWPNPRRPRCAFAPSSPYFSFFPRSSRSPSRALCPSIPLYTSCASAPTPPPPPSSSTKPPDVSHAEQVQTRLESTRTRLCQLQTRVVVRAGEASIQDAQQFLDMEGAEVGGEGAVLGRLKRELRNLRLVCREGMVAEEALQVVAELERVVEGVSGYVAARRMAVGGMAHEEVEEVLVGGSGGVGDSEWNGRSAGGVGGGFGEVRRRFVEQSDFLKKRATSVTAGIGEKVGEFFKEDGSVDVEGVRGLVGGIVDDAAVVWRRLNGLGEGKEGVLGGRDLDREFQLREEIGRLEGELATASKEREKALRTEDQLGKLIRAKEIRLMDDGVSALRRTLAIRVLQLEMEKIFVSVANEIESVETGALLEQRVLVVEFGDLDERLASLQVFVEEEEPLLIDDDVLGELAADIQDLKTRLGLDEPLYSSATISWPQMQQFFTSSARKARAGVDFYSRGMRLFAGDLRFAIRLIRRAITGYNPSPREIRTLRRTGRDLLTLVPFTIVLIAPLTPVGHVLIFSFLQRFWPEFFPSTFSERRQELMKKHEQYALSLGEENSSDGLDGDVSIDGVGEGRGKNGSRLSMLRKLLFFGFWSGEAKDENRVKSVTSAEGEGGPEDLRESLEINVDNGPPEENGSVGQDATPGNGNESAPQIALSDLAESVTDSEKVAKKRRRAMAIEELHLAD
eukprot:GFKZ01010133.1.p1 GENE.GFKZ01010133.1~~GFKZ01010133.1.p1  ORF type:complete len:693 (-),score=150.90 GFKZ01010133.1:1508-3586(-)